MVIQDLAKRAMIRNSRWPSYPYMVKKHSNDLFSRLLGQFDVCASVHPCVLPNLSGPLLVQ